MFRWGQYPDMQEQEEVNNKDYPSLKTIWNTCPAVSVRERNYVSSDRKRYAVTVNRNGNYSMVNLRKFQNELLSSDASGCIIIFSNSGTPLLEK